MGKAVAYIFVALWIGYVVVTAIEALIGVIAANIVPIGIGIIAICVLWLLIIAARSPGQGSAPRRRDVYMDAYIPPGMPTISERQARRHIEEYRDLEARIRENTNR